VQAGEGHLRGGNHPKVLFHVMIEVVGELGQLTAGEQGVCFYHEGQVFFGVTLAGVQIQHPGNKGALEACACAAQDVKA